jgi:hypothetical protein
MESSLDRYKKRKNMLHQILNLNSDNKDINQEEIYEIMVETIDKDLLQKTTKKIDDHYNFNHDFTVSKDEAKEFLEQFKNDFNQERFDKLIIDCRKEVINSIVTLFGLGKIVSAYDKVGGNITSTHNFKKGIVSTLEDQSRYEEWQRILNPNENDYDYRVDSNGKIKKITPIQQDRETHHDKLKDKWKKNQYKKMTEGEIVTDGYSGKKLGTKTNNQIKKDNSIDGEHITSVSEIENDLKNHLFARGKNKEERLADRANLSGHEDNLTLIDGGMNSSKSHSDLMEWANSPISKKHAEKTANPNITNAEYYELDNQRIQEAYSKSKNHIKSTQLRNQVLKQGKEITSTGAIEASKMGMQQAIGLVMTEFFTALFDEILDIYKNGFSNGFEDDRFFIVLKERLKNIAQKIQSKWKEVAIAFKDGFLSGFISNLVTTAINMFVTTGKRVVRIIREGIYSLLRAVKLLTFPPENMNYAEAMHEAKKIIASGLIISLGVIAEEYIDTLIKGSVILEPLSDILTTIFVGAITGLAVTMTVYYIDKSKNDKDAIKELLKQTDEKFENIDILLSKLNY